MPKVQKIKKPKKKVRLSDIFFIIISLVLTLAVFVGLIVMENKLSGKVVYKDVVTAKTAVPANTVITQDNIGKYFELKGVDIVDDVAGSLASADSLIGRQTMVDLVQGEIVTVKDTKPFSEYFDALENPVRIAISIDSIANMAGGRIRAGHVINISAMFDISTMMLLHPDKDVLSLFPLSSGYIVENIRVAEALDANGNVIDPNDTKTIASFLILDVEKGVEEKINNALTNGRSLRVSRVMSTPGHTSQ